MVVHIVLAQERQLHPIILEVVVVVVEQLVVMVATVL
jgi:hypothetical protein